MTINKKTSYVGNYQRGRTANIAYIVIHYTGNRKDTAKNNADYFAREYVGQSAHYFVDRSEVWQSVPDTDTAWHCGTNGAYKHPSCRNKNSIGIEMCDSVGSVPEETEALTAQLTRYLMEKYNIKADHVLRHYDVTGKMCPAPYVKETAAWLRFKTRLEEDADMDEAKFNEMFKKAMDAYKKAEQNEPVSSYAAAAFKKAKDNKIMDGTMPKSPMTREQAAAILDRLGLLD